MPRWTLFMVLLSCWMCFTSADWGYDGIDTCSRPYTLVYRHNHLGVAEAGSKTALKNAVLRGSAIRLVVTSVNGAAPEDFIVTGVNNINIRGSEVCASVLEHVGQNVYQHMPTTTYWYQLFCTTGAFHSVNQQVDGNTTVSAGLGTAGISWFAWDPSPCKECVTPLYSHFMDGGTHTGLLANLVNAVSSGKQVSVMRRDVGYVTKLEMLQVAEDQASVNGQNVWHIGQSYAPNGVTYNTELPYRWISSWSSLGRRHNQRYEYGGQTPVYHSLDSVGLEWFVDPCWRLVFAGDDKTDTVLRHVADLIAAVDHGHRLRVKIDGQVMEARSIKVKADQSLLWVQLSDKIAQKGGVGEDKFDFVDDTYWVWTFADTNGVVVEDFYFYGNNTMVSPRVTRTSSVSWYVDTRAWTPVLEVQAGGIVTSGSKANLQTAIRSGANIRFKVKEMDTVTYLTADNAIFYKTTGEDSVAQSVRILGTDLATGLLTPPVWHFYLVNTKGSAEIAVYRYGEDNSFQETIVPAADITFYADDHVPVV